MVIQFKIFIILIFCFIVYSLETNYVDNFNYDLDDDIDLDQNYLDDDLDYYMNFAEKYNIIPIIILLHFINDI